MPQSGEGLWAGNKEAVSNCSDPSRSVWMGSAWKISAVWVEEGGDRKGTRSAFSAPLHYPLPFQELKCWMLGAVLQGRPQNRRGEIFGIQDNESSRALY